MANHGGAWTNASVSPYPPQVSSRHPATWAPPPWDNPEMHPMNLQLSCSPSPKFPTTMLYVLPRPASESMTHEA